jgi:signal transduction histidine kinase
VRGALFRVLVITKFRVRQRALQDQKLSALIAHDLRAALGAVAMAMDVLRATHSSAGNNYQRTAEEAQAALKFMDLLVEDLVQASQTDATTLSLTKQTLRPRQLLDLALPCVLPLVRHRALGILCSEKLPAVEADPHRFTQVLANLLSNAVRVSPADADLCIRVRRGAGGICFSVFDGGPGLPPSAVALLSGNPPATPPHTRRGLGLSIARSIIEAHSGKIWAESSADRGGGVSFTLPVASADVERS